MVPRTASMTETKSPWLVDLLQIKTFYGRFVYLAALQHACASAYEQHYDVAIGSFPSFFVNQGLEKIHQRLFRRWARFPLERKKADIDRYIRSVQQVDGAGLIDLWLRTAPYRNLIPASVQGLERQEHLSVVEAILGSLRSVSSVSVSD
jgi:hypothetical protein